jgi:hypothetical protein
MDLDADEAALLDEISIKPPEKKVVTFKPKPVLRKPEETEPIPADVGAFVNTSKAHQRQMFEEPQVENEEEEFQAGEYDVPPPTAEAPSKGYNTIEEEKADLINKLHRLQKKGFSPGRKYGVHNDVEELRTEFHRITYSIEADQSIKFQRRMLMACVTGLEFMNKRYDPFDLKLDGWSESMMENIEEYDTVFEDLYAKYRNKVSVAPEIKLVMMVGGSAMMFHLTSSMFKAAVPNMNDVMKQNPELVQNMMQAVQNAQRQPQNPSVNGGRREMRGPGIDISQMIPPGLLGNPVTSRPPPSVSDDLSDLVSVESGDTTKDISISGSKKRRRSKKEQNVVSI